MIRIEQIPKGVKTKQNGKLQGHLFKVFKNKTYQNIKEKVQSQVWSNADPQSRQSQIGTRKNTVKYKQRVQHSRKKQIQQNMNDIKSKKKAYIQTVAINGMFIKNLIKIRTKINLLALQDKDQKPASQRLNSQLIYCKLFFFDLFFVFFASFIKLYIFQLAANLQFLQSMNMNQQLQRIRLLQNRMRRQSRNHNNNNQQSMKTIKSCDSKKMRQLPVQNQKVQNNKLKRHSDVQDQNQSQEQQRIILPSQQQIKKNKKITDYFKFSQNQVNNSKINPPCQSPVQQKKIQQIRQQIPEIELNNSNSKTKFTVGTDQQSSLRQENNILREKLRQRQESLLIFKAQTVQYAIKMHKMKRNQLRQKVSNNKVRLGQYISDKKGKDIWVDGLQIRQIKEKIQSINRQKQQLQKQKKMSKKSNKDYVEDPEQWKNSIASQAHFLSREETHCQQVLKKLQQQKMLHIKQYKLLYEQEHSKYGKIDPNFGVTVWPKIKKYQLLGLLGKGGFSQVYKAFDTQQMREVACKVHQFHSNWNSSAKQNYIKHALRQNTVHKALSHPNIVRLFDTVQIDSNSFCTVLQYCQGPDLSYYLKKHRKIPQKQAKMIIRQVINAIRYLHTLPDKVIHYDLKPQNIMFHKGKIKITDFGLCKTTKEDSLQLTSQGVGTYWYLPPECFQTQKKAVITPKVDIWSLGVVYYEMLFGQKPIGDKMSQMRMLSEGVVSKAKSVNFPANQKNSVSTQSKQFIQQCLRYNVQQRIDILTAANHKLFQRR